MEKTSTTKSTLFKLRLFIQLINTATNSLEAKAVLTVSVLRNTRLRQEFMYILKGQLIKCMQNNSKLISM